MDAVGALDPDPAADTASRLPLAPILDVSTADAPLSPRVTRRSGAIFGLVPSTGAPGPDAAAHPGSPGGGFGGSPYGPGGSYGGDTRETQQYTDYQCVHARIPPTSPDASRRARCASNQISPTRALRTIAPPTIRVVISPPRLFTTPHRNMGNGWVQRTRRSTVERVIERVHTDVNEMVPVHHGGMNGGAGSGHLGGGRATTVPDPTDGSTANSPGRCTTSSRTWSANPRRPRARNVARTTSSCDPSRRPSRGAGSCSATGPPTRGTPGSSARPRRRG